MLSARRNTQKSGPSPFPQTGRSAPNFQPFFYENSGGCHPLTRSINASRKAKTRQPATGGALRRFRRDHPAKLITRFRHDTYQHPRPQCGRGRRYAKLFLVCTLFFIVIPFYRLSINIIHPRSGLLPLPPTRSRSPRNHRRFPPPPVLSLPPGARRLRCLLQRNRPPRRRRRRC